MRNYENNPGEQRSLRIVEDKEGEPRKLFWGLVLLLVVAGLILYVLINSYSYPKDQELAIYLPPETKKTSDPTPSPSSTILSAAVMEDMRKSSLLHPPPQAPPPPGAVGPPSSSWVVPPPPGAVGPPSSSGAMPPPPGAVGPPSSSGAMPPPPGVVGPPSSSGAVPPSPGSFKVPPPRLRPKYGGGGKPLIPRRFKPDEPTPDKTVDFVGDKKNTQKKIPVTIYSNAEGFVFIDNKIGRRCYGKTKSIKEKARGIKYCLKTSLKPGDYQVELEKNGYSKAIMRIWIQAGMEKQEVYLQIFAK
ncbi:MAG: hypothetical protein K8T10_08525 [Candidatus Eremiobacteraeota bacterium]|nr:hypothetical protein [Candidatus Eremiobacteraeota bacterium]